MNNLSVVVRSTGPNCPCGKPLLHYPSALTSAFMAREVRRFGPLVTVPTPSGTWRIPRHFLVQHSDWIARRWKIPALADRHDFERLARRALGRAVGSKRSHKILRALQSEDS